MEVLNIIIIVFQNRRSKEPRKKTPILNQTEITYHSINVLCEKDAFQPLPEDDL